jgi:hypothetical protein
MKRGAPAKDPKKIARQVCGELLEMFPATFNGYNILAGKALYLAVINHNSPRGAAQTPLGLRNQKKIERC